MLCAQSVLRSTDTSAETTTPLADSSVHDRLDKASPRRSDAYQVLWR